MFEKFNEQQRHARTLRLLPLFLCLAGCLTPAPPRYTSAPPPSEEEFYSLSNNRLVYPDAAVPAEEGGERPDPSGTKELTIEKDSRGREHAVYVLKAGEALYSAVVVRFCGVVAAEEVNALAEKIMVYNGIMNSSMIPTGAKIKIPLEYLDEEILRGATVKRAPLTIRSGRRGGLHVILDAGHGGNDPGTTVRGWSEDEIAYDLMVRLKWLLQRRSVEVYPLVADGDTGDKPQNGRLVRNNRNEFVQVTPPYKMEDSRVALNMRVYLVDDIYRRLRRRGVRDEDIMLISIHLDHLHPSVNGVMVYYPDATERPATYSAAGSIYASFDESRISTIHYERAANEQVEAYSQDFSASLIASCRKMRVPVHEYQPIRRFVFRSGRKWTPGIVQFSRVRTSVLIEAANLANTADFNRIRSAAFRQRIAEAIARAIR
jgi:N-acetylmuramoyl-L-alanine amidase